MFENKTNSPILDALQIDESILKYEYMKGKGMGLELLQALHEVISPEEIFKHGKAIGITKNQIEKLKLWLESDCKMSAAMKKADQGYGFVSRAIFDNGSWGILTKIRRHLLDWQPSILPFGEIQYKHFRWLDKPEVIFENEDTKLVKREMPQGVLKYSGMSNHFHGIDYFYGEQRFCFKKEGKYWRKATYAEKQEILDAIKVMELMVA